MTRAFGLLLLLPALLAGCAGMTAVPDPQVRAALAPTGTLRVGSIRAVRARWCATRRPAGRPASRWTSGRRWGSAWACRCRWWIHRVAQVLEAVKAGQVDFTFTNSTEVRAATWTSLRPLVQIELGYIVPVASAIATAADVDRPASASA